ncbi:MAG: hypothetical protein B7Z80_11895 [Rhodospirillales bacterium 20-64-7]|nr:MAG: hypothetical protein B7Z80_11895 [Rhodospirillales bacterium 20-64-7]HQT79480.1 aliphatic sulfonate ABC transporter substrate-binding protein [Rhodopila sp.]
MLLNRRHLLAAPLATWALRGHASRAADTRVLRIGYQKGQAVQLAARANRSLEAALAPLGVRAEWTEFPYGAALLEAARVGSIDLGAVGDTPPLFAQAAHASLVYAAMVQAAQTAILLPPNSPIRTIQDLKGKRIAFTRGSTAQNFLLMALDKAGLHYSDIQPAMLNPADAGAAFQRGAIDAWSIWDPYFAVFQGHPGVRILVSNKDLGDQNAFFMAGRGFAQANGPVLAKAIDTFAAAATWAAGHRAETGALLAEGTGLPPDAAQRVVDRLPFAVRPMTTELIQSQQGIADRFRALGLLPTDIKVADAVWHATKA